MSGFTGKRWGWFLAMGVASILLVVLVYVLARNYEIAEAEKRVRDTMLECRAFHRYVQRDMHPAYYKLIDEGRLPKGFYAPELLSSTHISRTFQQHYNEERREAGLPEIRYKVAAADPRNAVNKATTAEADLITWFNEDKARTSYREIVEEDGKNYLVYARPFLATQQHCLRCHGTPANAPAELRDRYQWTGGWNRKVGDIVAAEIIRSPLEGEYNSALTATAGAIVVLGGGLLLLGFNRRLRTLVDRRTRALRESEERFRAAFDSAQDCVLVWDKDHNYLYANQAAIEHVATTSDRVVGKNIRDGLSHVPEFMHLWIRRIDRVFETGEELRFQDETEMHGRSYVTDSILSPVRDADGAVTSICVVYRDITELRQFDARRRALEAQLSQARKMEAVGRLAGGVAHDFNNMLLVILGNAQMALDDRNASLSIRESLQEIRNAALRSADLTQQLLAFARKQTIAPKVLDLNETVVGMLTMMRRLIGEGVDLTWEPGPDLLPVKIDPGQVDQVLANLCVNARDAIDGVGKIVIKTKSIDIDNAYCAAHADSAPGTYVQLTVSDNGQGMDADTLANIFEPFFTTKDVGEGTGLGLATVYGIVRQNEGFIDVRSTPGRGTTCCVHLPAHVSDPEQAPTHVVTPPPGGNETVLLVEDEPAIARLGTALLKSLGYHVLSAATPDEAIDLAGRPGQVIHLLLTDVVMPQMNGGDLAERLGREYPGLKHMFMSGYTADAIARQGVLDPNVHFIQKPFSRDELAAKVRQALDET